MDQLKLIAYGMDLEPKQCLENPISVELKSLHTYYLASSMLKHAICKQATCHKRGNNPHLSCKRDCCPCQNSKSSGVSLYPPQFLGLGIKLLQAGKTRLFPAPLELANG